MNNIIIYVSNSCYYIKHNNVYIEQILIKQPNTIILVPNFYLKPVSKIKNPKEYTFLELKNKIMGDDNL